MRNEVERIRAQFNQAFYGDSWHGEFAFSVLEKIPGAVAARRVGDAHTIREIVLHTSAWLDAVHERVGSHVIRSLTDAEDWPTPPEGPDHGWPETLAELKGACSRIDTLLGELDDADLERTIVGQRKEWTVYEDLHGVIQHSLYHLGQIVVLARVGAADR